MQPSTDASTLGTLRSGGKRALADALARLETAPDHLATVDLLDAALDDPRGTILGLTGPPGVGKSTLTDALIRAWRRKGSTVGVIAIDPSSALTGGALLGDRTRLTTDPSDQGVFIRSMAARDRLGGVAEQTFPAAVLMRALFDLVIIETVGIGQSETEIAGIADLTAFLAQPGSGDALQYMKAGIMEVPDLVIVTKSDMGAVARRTASDLRGALSLSSVRDVPVLACSASENEGVDAVLHEICNLIDQMSPRFADRRRDQAKSWSDRQIQSQFGTMGFMAIAKRDGKMTLESPFRGTLDRQARLSAALSAAFG